ncbi:MAG: hypothetical protein JXR16_08860 [Bermanella sp.]
MQFTHALGRTLPLVIAAAMTSGVSYAADQTDLENRVEALEKVQITGSYRMNYTVQDWNERQEDRGGDFRFNQLNLGVETEKNGVRLSAQYRMYDNSNPSMIHHLYFATDIDDQSEVQVGITKVPFGIQPYESHNDWGDNALFMGFNDDYDAGIKYITQRDALNVQVAYFSNGDTKPTDAERFSADVVSSKVTDPSESNYTGQFNEEAHQLNVHTSYKVGGSEFGGSVQLTGLYNSETKQMGDAWAAAVFLNGKYDALGVQLQAGRYEYNPENPAGVSEDSIQMGAFGATYQVAAKANMYVANFHYDLPYKGGIVDLVRVYSDYNLIDKDESSFKDSQIHTVGMMIATGDLYTFVDLTSGKNALFVGGGDYQNALAAGDGEDKWNRFLNIQFGYYF